MSSCSGHVTVGDTEFGRFLLSQQHVAMFPLQASLTDHFSTPKVRSATMSPRNICSRPSALKHVRMDTETTARFAFVRSISIEFEFFGSAQETEARSWVKLKCRVGNARGFTQLEQCELRSVVRANLTSLSFTAMHLCVTLPSEEKCWKAGPRRCQGCSSDFWDGADCSGLRGAWLQAHPQSLFHQTCVILCYSIPQRSRHRHK